MDQTHIAKSAFAPEAATDEPASPVNHDILDFDPVPLRYRGDGLTPERQREYVEALADCGVARRAADRIGVSEQAVNRVRRRADARSFDRACAAALRIGARRLVSVAFERAIEGTIKRHTYHGEIVSEERVYDNRLLMALIGKLPDLFEPGTEAVERQWPLWMEAVEQGLPCPAPKPEPEANASIEFENCEVWEAEEGEWRTNFPPPAGFDGYQEGEPGDEDYERELTESELRAIGADAESEAEALAEQLDRERAARDRFFGFAGGTFFPAKGCETYETSAEPASDSGAVEGLAEPVPATTARHCGDSGVEPGDEAIQHASAIEPMDCFAVARNHGEASDPPPEEEPPGPRLWVF